MTASRQSPKTQLQANYLTDLFSPEQGNRMPLDEFPALFATEAQTGLFGAGFVGLWLVFARRNVPELLLPENEAFTLWIISLFVVFFLLTVASVILTLRSSRWANNKGGVYRPHEQKRRAVWVRYGIFFLSSFYVITCGVLISLTGGPRSPFVPFYVMIFTLTIKRIKFYYPGVMVSVLFIIVLLASLGGSTLYLALNSTTIKVILTSEFQFWIASAFLVASLVVPTISYMSLEWGDRRKNIKDATSPEVHQ